MSASASLLLAFGMILYVWYFFHIFLPSVARNMNEKKKYGTPSTTIVLVCGRIGVIRGMYSFLSFLHTNPELYKKEKVTNCFFLFFLLVSFLLFFLIKYSTGKGFMRSFCIYGRLSVRPPVFNISEE